MPLIAQVTGAVALTALITGPWWARVPDQKLTLPAATTPSTPYSAAVVESPATAAAPASSTAGSAVAAGARLAHLNLDVRHSFKTVDFSVSIDGQSVVETKLDGSGKRFKVFGKRAERGYTKTLELAPGVRLVKVRVRSLPDKFDQTRIERFDLGAASVAALRVAADKSGLTLVAERPSSAPPAVAATAVPPAGPPAAAGLVETAAPAPAPATVPQQAAATHTSPATATVIEFLQSLRSMLIGIAGFVASTATAFVVQEWLRTRRNLIFKEQAVEGPRQRRRRRVQGAITE